MHRYFILLLVVLMPLKALAASFGICDQDANTHRKQHHSQAEQSLQATASFHEHEQLKSQQVKNECTDCNLCHTACGTFVITLADGLLLPITTSQNLQADLATRLKAQPSDPPYRPKWRTLA